MDRGKANDTWMFQIVDDTLALFQSASTAQNDAFGSQTPLAQILLQLHL